MTRTTRHDSSVPRWCWPAAVVLGALLVGGCTGGEPEVEESQLPLPASVTASPSASASDEPSAEASPEASGAADAGEPERPAAMDRDDGKGAAAAVDYFFQVQHHMLLTGDRSTYKELSHRACGYCDSTLDNAKWLSDTGSSYEGGAVEVEVLSTYQRDPVTGVTPLDIRVKTEELTIRDSDGAEVDHVGAQTTEIRAELGQRDGRWIVVGMPAMPEVD